jgi:DNA-binding transcriptional LysR family regulator
MGFSRDAEFELREICCFRYDISRGIFRASVLLKTEQQVMDLEDMRSFVEVVDRGGFNRAAVRLGVSKSIISRRIAALEADLGVRLLTRSTRGITPTEAGLEFKARCERILAEVAEARDAVVRQGGDMVGRLRIAAPLSFGVRHVAPLLAEMAERYPRLEIEVAFADRVTDLIGERFDAAVRIGALRDSSLIARRIAPVRSVLAASPAYLARHGRPSSPDDLLRHQCLIYTGSAVLDWSFRFGRRWVTIRPSGRLRSDSGDVLLKWAIAGLGIANLPSFLTSEAVRDGTLESLLPEYTMPEFGVYVVRPPGPQVPAKVRALIDIMVERFSGNADWS